MKLYNTYQQVILEESDKKLLLTEDVAESQIIDIINQKVNVNIEYLDEGENTPSKRYIQIYVFGVLENGFNAVRAYQINGGSRTGKNYGEWKIFRLDRIVNFIPTKMRWSKPVSDYDASIDSYNPNGDMKGNFIKGQKVNTFKNIKARVSFDNKQPQANDVGEEPIDNEEINNEL